MTSFGIGTNCDGIKTPKIKIRNGEMLLLLHVVEGQGGVLP